MANPVSPFWGLNSREWESAGGRGCPPPGAPSIYFPEGMCTWAGTVNARTPDPGHFSFSLSTVRPEHIFFPCLPAEEHDYCFYSAIAFESASRSSIASSAMFVYVFLTEFSINRKPHCPLNVYCLSTVSSNIGLFPPSPLCGH